MNIVCVICSDLLVQSDDVYHTPCGHVFHLQCLTQWLERSKSCPQCREKVTQKKVQRLFFTFSNNEVVESNSNSLQERIDSLKFQILLKEKDIKYYTSKNVTLEKQNAGLRKEVRKVESEINQKNSAIHALKEQTKFFKQQSLESDNLRKEIARLKKKIEDLRPIQALLHAPPTDVNEMVGKTRDPGTLITYISIMKKELLANLNKCKQLRITIKRLQEELTKVSIECDSLLEEQSKRMRLEEELVFSESKNMSLQRRVNELEEMLGITEHSTSIEIKNAESKNNTSEESTMKKLLKTGNDSKEKSHKRSTISKRRKEKTPTDNTSIEEIASISEMESINISIKEESITSSSINESISAPKRSRISIERKESDNMISSNKSIDIKCTDQIAHSKSRKKRDNNKKELTSAKKEVTRVKSEICSPKDTSRDDSIIDLT